MRSSLEKADTVINLRNQEIATLNSRLAAKDETVAELDEQIDRLESQIEQERAELQENSDIDFDFAGKAGELVSWLRKVVGKALPKQVTVKEVQKILEGGDN